MIHSTVCNTIVYNIVYTFLYSMKTWLKCPQNPQRLNLEVGFQAFSASRWFGPMKITAGTTSKMLRSWSPWSAEWMRPCWPPCLACGWWRWPSQAWWLVGVGHVFRCDFGEVTKSIKKWISASMSWRFRAFEKICSTLLKPIWKVDGSFKWAAQLPTSHDSA